MKRVLTETLVIGMSASLLWHFSCIWRYGQLLVQEPSVIVLTLETMFLAGVLAFGVYMLVEDWRGNDRIYPRTTPELKTSHLVSGKLSVDFASNEVRVNGKPVKLTATESKLLHHLIRNEGRLLSYQNLLTKVWGKAYIDDRGLLRAHIQHLRQKLDDSTELPKIIVTEHRMGYKFVMPTNR